MITEIIVNGLFGIKENNHRIEIDDSDKGNLVYIYSPNCCGKTTLLKLVYVTLVGEANKLFVNFKFNDISIKVDNHLIKIVKNKNTMAVYFDKEHELIKNPKTLLTKYYQFVKDNDFFNISLFLHDVQYEDKQERINSIFSLMSFIISATTIYTKEYNAIKKNFKKDERIKTIDCMLKEVSCLRLVSNKETIKHGIGFYPIKKEANNYIETFKDELYTAYEDYLKPIVLFIKCVNEMLDKKISVTRKDVYFTTKNKDKIKLHELSENELNIIFILSKIVFNENKTTYLLDEPTLGLNATMPYKLKEVLENINKILGHSFIVATSHHTSYAKQYDMEKREYKKVNQKPYN